MALLQAFYLICFNIYLALVVVGVIIGQNAVNTQTLSSTAENLNGSEKNNSIDICSTPECIHTASNILKNMDPNVDPCDDFYKFSCGGFLNSTVISGDKESVTTFDVIGNYVKQQLQIIFEEESSPNEPRPYRLVKDFYKACMNETAIREHGVQPLLDNLRKLGGWPVLEGEHWNETDFNWTDFVYKLRKLGYSIDNFIGLDIKTDFKNSSKHVIYLDQASLGLSREFLVKGWNNKIVQAYARYMLLIALSLEANLTLAVSELRESLEFEFKLANISLPREKRRNYTFLYNPMTVDELSAAYPSIPWLEYLNTILAPQSQLNQNETVIVMVPSYLENFEVLMSKTPKRVQANYALWRVVAASLDYNTDDIRKRQLMYRLELSGRTEREPRWKECVDKVSGSLAISVGSMYVRKYFKEDTKKAVLEIINDVRNELTKILQKVEWMDEKTRANALEKASSMTSYIAYPNELLDLTKLDEFYKELELNANDYLGNILNLTVFGMNYSFGKLRKLVNETEWISHGKSTVINAFYSANENSIQLPAGILQSTFISNDRPRYMNYGAIGSIIGHEITHGFDDQGRQFNKDGNLVDWWEPETKDNFLKKTECIIHQYGNYTVKEIEMNLDGINTQGENIADNGGVKEAYYAYKEWVKRNGREPKLPDLFYTPEQMFWISAANTWCSKYRPEAMKSLIATEFHNPGEFRTQGILSNMEEFSRDYNCPIGSKMNPVKKCAVW